MKYAKMLGLLAVAAAAMMAFAASASATIITSPHGSPYTGHIEAKTEGHAVLVGPVGIKVECPGTVTGTALTHGPNATAEGAVTGLTFGPCTNGDVAHVEANGTLQIHWKEANVGTVTSYGATVTVTDQPTGLTCGYRTDPVNGTDVGNATGSTRTLGKATIHINGTIPRHFGGGLCGLSGQWTGSYQVETPVTLDIDP